MSTPVAAGTLSRSSPAAPRVWARRWRRRLAALAESTPATVGLAIVLAWGALALLAPLLAPYSPNANDMA
ncbi:MAG TPA: ABC transporter permease, partial [Methylomirabilota bacterium]|nr:ABC transporter permease [Methylomirabilota bacterium]